MTSFRAPLDHAPLGSCGAVRCADTCQDDPAALVVGQWGTVQLDAVQIDEGPPAPSPKRSFPRHGLQGARQRDRPGPDYPGKPVHKRAARTNELTNSDIKEPIMQSAVYHGVLDAHTVFRIPLRALQELNAGEGEG